MNRLLPSCVIILTLATLVPLAHCQVSPKREFRGVWLTTVWNSDWPLSPGLPSQTQQDQLKSYLDTLHALGINIVFLQIRPECDAFYQSSIEPWSFWLTGAQGTAPAPLYDPLAFAVEEAHKRGMELHAWFNPYRVIIQGSSYQRAATHISNTHPDWVLTVNSTKILDPGMSLVRAYVLSVIADVVHRYDIDGVVMDDYFYVDGIASQDATTFAAEGRGFTDISDWRRDNVNILVKAIYDTINIIKPWVKFGMSPRGIWKNGIPPGTSGSDNYSVIYCDAVAWLQGKYIDYFSPQLYWKFSGAQDYSLLEPWWATQLNGRLYCPSLAAYRIGDVNFGDAGEIARQIRFNRNSGNTHGAVPFTAHNLTQNNGGIGDTLRNDLNRYLALPPIFPWKDVIAPYPPRAIRYEPLASGGQSVIQWDLPLTAPDGDSASRYAVYRFDHRPTIADFENPRNLVSVEGRRYYAPPVAGGSGVYFAVTALDRNYNESDTSNIVSMTAPAVPVLALPIDGSIDIPESAYVQWWRVPGAGRYHLQVSADSNFAAAAALEDSLIGDTVRVLAGLAGHTKYSWRVRAANGAGYSSFSEAFTFTTGTPHCPSLVYPPDVTTNIPVSLVFRWNRIPDATRYRLQLSTTTDFSSITADSAGITDTALTYSGLQNFTIYSWRMKAANTLGYGEWSPALRFRTIQVSAVREQETLPSTFALDQNFPNPFNPSTTIQFSLPTATWVTLRVYDLLGREETTLVNDNFTAGSYSVTWDASNAASGVYFYRLTAGAFVQTRRMLLLR